MAKYYYHDVARWEGEGGSHGALKGESAHPGNSTYRTVTCTSRPARGLAQCVERRSEGMVVPNRWRILAPVDLSSEAEMRVQHALNTADALHGDLTLLYVISGRARSAERMEWPANAIAGHRKGEVRRLVLPGSLPETVARYADDLGADLITLTSGSYRWWNRLWRRSAAAAITNTTHRPTYVAKLSPAAPVTSFRSILCVVALDGTDEPLIRFSEEMAQRCDATLVVLHVVPEPTEALLAFGVPGADDRPLSPEVAERRMRDVTSALSVPHLTAIRTGSAYRSGAYRPA